MKKILFVAAITIFGLSSCDNNSSKNAETEVVVETVTENSSDIAYVQVEAVLAESDLFKTEGAALQQKSEKAQGSWATKEKNLQHEAAQLQEKYQKGLITTKDATSRQQEIERKAVNFQTASQKEARTLEEANFVFTNRAQDFIQRAIKDINSDRKYKMIINATALVDADTTLNITPLVLAKVNELYAAEKK